VERNVLITGASWWNLEQRLLGFLASFGLKVWINYRSGEDRAKRVKDEIISNGGEAEVIGFDVTDEKALYLQ